MFILQEIEKIAFLKIVYSLMMEDNNFSDLEKNILENILCKEIFHLNIDVDEYETKYSSTDKLIIFLKEIRSDEAKIFLFKILSDIANINHAVRNQIIDKIKELKHSN